MLHIDSIWRKSVWLLKEKVYKIGNKSRGLIQFRAGLQSNINTKNKVLLPVYKTLISSN